MNRKPEIGNSVIFYDPVGKPHNALITNVFGPTCINVVYVSSDESRGDSYGRQTERNTSLLHGDSTPAHGNYWKWPDEEPNPINRGDANLS